MVEPGGSLTIRPAHKPLHQVHTLETQPELCGQSRRTQFTQSSYIILFLKVSSDNKMNQAAVMDIVSMVTACLAKKMYTNHCLLA